MSIDTHLISGFLGSGKTTTLNALLRQKPVSERWGILINEFGELGLDERLIIADNSVLLRQISGGCLCCTQGAAFRLALEQLISFKPNRILIEPTGLGHPGTIIQQLVQHPHIQYHSTFVIVDIQQVLDPQYQSEYLWQQMFNGASYIVLNKLDQVSSAIHAQAIEWLQQHYPQQKKISVEYGQLPLKYFTMPVPLCTQPCESKVITHISRVEQQGQGYQSCGWQFPQTVSFNHQALIALLQRYQVRRVKAHLHTDIGWRTINGLGRQINSCPAKAAATAKLELIHSERLNWPDIEQELQNVKTG
ncbi:CobW family GTP-binding protein [Celerinatantimonas sp. YJH-8]|uniref:CobW family GTP-binding protein n=1 Tax=Celerinatantimonas sp. YJH-8 TaxID=3228714 RepID=UPI0038CBC377